MIRDITPEIFFGHLRTVWSLRKSILKFFCDLRLITILRNSNFAKFLKKCVKKLKKCEACPPPRGMLRPTWEYHLIVKSCQIIYLASERKNLGHISRSFFKNWQNGRFFGHFLAQLTTPLWNPPFCSGMSQHDFFNLH